MLKLIKSHDLFGHSVHLQFNQKGNTHNTVIGGIFSVFIKLVVLLYTAILFKKLIEMEGDTNGSFIEPQNFEEVGELKMNETDVIMMLNLFEANTFRPLEYDDEMKRFI